VFEDCKTFCPVSRIWHLPPGERHNDKYPVNTSHCSDLCKKCFTVVLFGSNGNSHTVLTKSDVCIHTHVLHNIGTLVGQKKYKILEQQWMPRAKEISPSAILGRRAVGWSTLDQDTCEATRCHSSLPQLSAILGCYAVLTGKRLPSFRRTMSSSSGSAVQGELLVFLGCWIRKMKTLHSLRNVGNYLPKDIM